MEALIDIRDRSKLMGQYTFEDYADAIIEDATKGIAALRQIDGGWIPVSERLPDKGVLVLVCESDWRMSTDEIMQNDWGDKKWCFEEGITHWQPLPPPPEGEVK
jgi:hypothetical protein